MNVCLVACEGRLMDKKMDGYINTEDSKLIKENGIF